MQSSTLFRKLSFELDLQPSQTIYLAYSVPYTYSQLLNDIKHFRKQAAKIQEIQFQVNFQNQSLSGLEIPQIRIHTGTPGEGKFCIFMIGRQHPGEANSSYAIKGTIEQLLSGSQSSMKVLQNCDFVIIPMVNPDGVVSGNFRTSLFGKDLNRLFKSKDTTLIPEVQMVRSVFSSLYETYKKKLLLFLDYHGHSTRKNSFVLGPGIFDSQMINDIRVLPKIMAEYTQVFRYPSCSFRLSQEKKTTARALFGRFAGLSYTIETSNWAYYSHQTKEIIEMTAKHFEQLGRSLAKAVQEYLLSKLQSKSKYNFRLKQEENRKLKIIKSKQDIRLRKSETTRDIQNNLTKNRDIRIYTENSIRETDLGIKNLERINEQRPPSVKEEANESDKLSESGMDTDSEGQDMSKEKFKKYIKEASQMLVEFEMAYYGNNYRKGLSKYQASNSRSNMLLQKQKKKKVESVQACLRTIQKKPEESYKIQKQEREPNLKKIYLQDIMLIRESSSSAKKEKDKEQQSISKMQGKKFKTIDKYRKNKAVLPEMTEETEGVTQSLARFQNFKLLNFQKANQYKRQERSLEKLKYSPKSRGQIPLKNEREKIPSLMEGLPIIKVSKATLEQSPSSSSRNVIPKTKDRFVDMLMSQQLLNKSTVTNVLKLSKIEQERSKQS